MSIGLNFEVSVSVDKSALINQATRNAIKQALKKTAHDIAADMVANIQGGTKSGRIYRKETDVSFTTKKGKSVSFTAYKGSKVEHQASAPGEAPATDTGNLVGSIEVFTGNIDSLEAEVRVNAEYAMNLEVGTAHMEPRPFMVPAVRRNEQPFRETVKAIVNKSIENA